MHLAAGVSGALEGVGLIARVGPLAHLPPDVSELYKLVAY
jgi:hypothetical protein